MTGAGGRQAGHQAGHVPGRAVLALGQPPAGTDGGLAAGDDRNWPSYPAETGRRVQRRPRPGVARLNPTDTLADAQRRRDAESSSNDHSIRRMTWWDHKGTEEWLSYRFATARAVSAARRSTGSTIPGIGQCRVPAEWRLLWRDGDGVEAGEADGHTTVRHGAQPVQQDLVRAGRGQGAEAGGKAARRLLRRHAEMEDFRTKVALTLRVRAAFSSAWSYLGGV